MQKELNWKRFNIKITLEEDLHSGTGTGGGGGIDAVQMTDREGRPVIRNSHFKGLLRDAAQELVYFGQIKKEEKIRLFGGRINDENGDNTIHRGKFVSTSFNIKNQKYPILWTSTAREPFSRTPLDDTLRTVEYVPAGSGFEGELELREPDLSDVLEKCLKHIDQLGSNRNRGDGLLKIDWDVKEENEIENTVTDLSPPTSNDTQLRLILRNKTPLCLPKTGFPGNILPTERFLRGQVVMGAFASWALDCLPDAEHQSLNFLFDRKIKFGNGYPLPKFKNDLVKNPEIKMWDIVPFPLHIQTKKIAKIDKVKEKETEPAILINQIWWAKQQKKDLLFGKSDEHADRFMPCDCEAQYKRSKGDVYLFRCSETEPWFQYTPEIAVHMRNQVPNRDNPDGSLFSDEEIVENTDFLIDIDFHGNEDHAKKFLHLFKNVLNGKTWLRIGRGGRPVEVVRAVWIEGKKDSKTIVGYPGSITVTLESDLIARSPQNFGFYNSLDPRMLAELVGIIDEENQFSSLPKNTYSYCDHEEIRGFNAASGLPRTPVLAIRRGSAIHIQSNESNCEQVRSLCEKLCTTEHLGERTWEGFGRFRLNFDPLKTNREFFTKNPKWKCEYLVESNSEHCPDVSFIENREILLKDAKSIANQLPTPDEGGPNISQWRYAQEQIRLAKDVNSIQEIFNRLTEHEKKRAGKCWESKIKNGQEILAFLKKEFGNRKEKYQEDIETIRFLFDSVIRWHVVVIKEETDQEKTHVEQ
ncbi:MAG: hypothetical protein C4527_01660 [Candidatus Omnitrophota bacterium]|nr:MAG: hypothetical protein C4527_01660 [Candidatus Omnitrophota bacterium]